MASELVEKTVQIKAQANAVWAMLTNPEKVCQWMAGARVESTWQVGSPIRFSFELDGHTYRDGGTILEFEPERTLRYSHWSALSGLPESPEMHSLMSFRLHPGEGGTRLSLTHEHPATAPPEMAKHSNYFWGVALHVLKEIAEE